MARALPIRAAHADVLKERVIRWSVLALVLYSGSVDWGIRGQAPREVLEAPDGSTGGMSPRPVSAGLLAIVT